jgi:ABC-type multidrug transport system fused ATPase/permease subunit
MVHRSTTEPHGNRKDWLNIKRLLPYVWDFKGRVVISLACLVLSKLAIVGMPLVLKQIVDALDVSKLHDKTMLILPISLLLMYGAL